MIIKFNDYITIKNNLDIINENKKNQDNKLVLENLLNFIFQKKEVKKSELQDFLTSLQEKVNIKRPSWYWIRKNGNLIDENIDENGEILYSLTKRGYSFLKEIKNENIEIFESKIPENEIVNFIKLNVKTKPRTKVEQFELDKKLLNFFKIEFDEDEDDFDFIFKSVGIASKANDILDDFHNKMNKK